MNEATFLSVKELAEEFGVHDGLDVSSVSDGRIFRGTKVSQSSDSISERVLQAMEESSNAMPNKSVHKKRATGGASRRRAAKKRPRSVKRGRNFQGSPRRVS